MIYCPIMSYQRDATATKPCMSIDCAFADEAGDCLIRQALQCYVSAERTRVAEEEERLRKEAEMIDTYFAIRKDGTRTPIRFSHTPEDYPYPHGGTYEDLTDLRAKYDILMPIPDAKNPIRQVKTSDIETGIGY